MTFFDIEHTVKKAFFQLHLSILLAGWTGVFGKLMTLSPGLIVFWRIVIAGGCLWLWAWLTNRLEKVTRKDQFAIMGVGALLACQWTLFYASIKASNVSIGGSSCIVVGEEPFRQIKSLIEIGPGRFGKGISIAEQNSNT